MPNTYISTAVMQTTSFACVHINSAYDLLRSAMEKETYIKSLQEEDPQIVGTHHHSEYQSFCYGSIVMSAALMEASINEFYDDCNKRKRLENIDNEDKNRINEIWSSHPAIDRMSILEKYQFVLRLLCLEPFEKGDKLYQDANIVIGLRNILMHPRYSIEVTDATNESEIKYHNIYNKLKDKYELNPFRGKGNGFFPSRAISSGCAKWSFLSSVRFIDKFYQKLNQVSPYDHIRPLWQEL